MTVPFGCCLRKGGTKRLGSTTAAGGLAGHAALGEARHDVALQGREDDQDGNDDQDRAGHEDAPAGGIALVVLQQGQAHRQGHGFRPVRDDERPDVVVPFGHDGHQRYGGDGGNGHGDHDLPEAAPVPGPVHLGRFQDGRRQGPEVLPQQEGAERSAQAGEDDPPEGVLAADPRDEDEVGQDGHLRRHHEGHQDQQEDKVPEREADKDQGIRRQDRQDHFDGGPCQRDDGAVQEELAERDRGHGGPVVLQVQAFREDFQVGGDNLAGRLEGAEHHPQQGQEYHQGGNDQGQVAAHHGLDQVPAGERPVGTQARVWSGDGGGGGVRAHR